MRIECYTKHKYGETFLHHITNMIDITLSLRLNTSYYDYQEKELQLHQLYYFLSNKL